MNPRTKGDTERREIYRITLENQGNTLVGKNDRELFFWDLGVGRVSSRLGFGGRDLKNLSFQVTSGGSHLLVKREGEDVLYKMNLNDNLSTEKLVQLPKGLDCLKFVCNGDALLLRSGVDTFYDSEDDFYERAISKLSFLDIERAKDSTQMEATKYTKQSVKGLPNVEGEIDLFTSQDEIRCFSLVSNKGLESPKVFQNGRIVRNPDFFGKMRSEVK